MGCKHAALHTRTTVSESRKSEFIKKIWNITGEWKLTSKINRISTEYKESGFRLKSKVCSCLDVLIEHDLEKEKPKLIQQVEVICKDFKWNKKGSRAKRDKFFWATKM